MSLDQKPKTERAKAVKVPRMWSRALVAAAGFAVVLGVIGVVVLIDNGGPDTTESPANEPTTTTSSTTSAAPTTNTPVPTLSAEEQLFADSYFDAWNSDVDAQLALLSPEVDILVQSGVWHPFSVEEAQPLDLESFEEIARWGSVLGTEATLNGCEPRGGQARCDFTMTDVFLTGVNSPLSGTIDFEIADGVTSLVSVRWGGNSYYDQTGSFLEWLESDYLDHSLVMMVGSGEPIYTMESAELWRQLAPRYTGQDAPLTTDEAAFMASFFDAWNNDVEAYLALAAPDALIEQVGAVKWEIAVEEPTQISREKFTAKARFEAEIGTSTTVDLNRCLFRRGAMSCPFVTTDILIEGTSKEISGVVEIEAADDLAQRILYTWALNPTAGIHRGFKDWLEENHPAAVIEGFDEFTAEAAAVWIEYVPLFLEFQRG